MPEGKLFSFIQIEIDLHVILQELMKAMMAAGTLYTLPLYFTVNLDLILQDQKPCLHKAFIGFNLGWNPIRVCVNRAILGSNPTHRCVTYYRC